MPGYLRPHIQTVFPGSKVSDYEGELFIRPKDILLDTESLTCHLYQDIQARLVGQKFTSLNDNILRPLRNRIAHGLLEDSDDEIASDEEVYPYLPVVKYIAEQLILSEIGPHALQTNESIESDAG